MDVTSLAIPEVRLIAPAKHGDHRGFFSETYNKQAFAAAGIDVEFVQDNHSLSAEVGTLRGLHFQVPPRAQAKLLRVVRGAVFDVAVDLRRGSPSYGRHVSATISAAAWNQIFIPAGFAHGFCTLEPDTEVLYKVNDFYAPEAEQGLAWDDPALGIDWPVAAGAAILSERDRAWPALRDLSRVFQYEEGP
jgi:dTDP-4-dehydrorhamnose 3,5-epimerase